MKEQPVTRQYELKIGSLNYSGVLTSPYQFYDKQDEKQLLISQTFTSFVKQKYPQFAEDKGESFKWNMQSLDKRWKIRYSPTSVLDVGIKKQTNTMMNEEQFNRQWYRTHEKCKEEIRKYYQKTFQQEQIDEKMRLQVQRCYQYDLFCYKTLMKVYCGIDDINKMENLDSKTYLEKKQEDFSKPYLCEKQKIKSTKNSFHKLNFDLYYLQQTTEQFKAGVQDLHNYFLIKKQNNGSIILIKKKICPNDYNFEEENRKFFKKYSQILSNKFNKLITCQEIESRFNFNTDSILQILQNIILINVHLSSKKTKNTYQLHHVLEEVNNLVEHFPEYDIIVGGDFNSTVDRLSFSCLKKFKIPLPTIPIPQKRFSVLKKRSLMQTQRHKAGHLDKIEKDYIFSTFLSLKEQINLIDGRNIEEFQKLMLLPRTEHPYDHYLVTNVFQMVKNVIYQ